MLRPAARNGQTEMGEYSRDTARDFSPDARNRGHSPLGVSSGIGAGNGPCRTRITSSSQAAAQSTTSKCQAGVPRAPDGAANDSGYEAMHMIRKGQVRWLAKGDVLGQRAFIHSLFGIAA